MESEKKSANKDRSQICINTESESENKPSSASTLIPLHCGKGGNGGIEAEGCKNMKSKSENR